MKKLPIGIQAFETMRAQGYIYVDKTRHIYRMVTEGMFYFMARPRRFGKSLLVSTLQHLFLGRKDLFEGLWMAEHGDWDWAPHPVIVLDFNEISGRSPQALEQNISFAMRQIAQQYGITLTAPVLESQFVELILGLYEQTDMPVVVLIDEYDKRIIEHLGQGPERLSIAQANRDLLRSFFGVLKGVNVSAVLRFVFLTGVSRFSRVSVFSALNNLQDLSMHGGYADMLGYTESELDAYFGDYLARFAEDTGWSVAEVKARLARQYDGYRFSEKDVNVYNPFSVLNAFNESALKNYWFETGTPTFLVNQLKQDRYPLPNIEHVQVTPAVFGAFEIDHLYPEALLFQTGYVTIKDVQDRLYTLGYPNQEVKSAFTESLWLAWTGNADPEANVLLLKLTPYLRDEALDAFFAAVTAIFASIPYDIQTKRDAAYYHTIFYLMIAASGSAAQSSVLTSRGRIDMLVTFPDKAYILEFKCNQSADVAIQQIRDKGYAEPYRASGKKLILLGINFSSETRNVQEWSVACV